MYPGVSELWGVENRPLPLTRPMAYTTSLYYRTSRDGQRMYNFMYN